MVAQDDAVPCESHFCHWYVNTGFEPLHVPFDAVSVSPTTASPSIVGGVTFAGADAAITGVAADVPGADPSGVVAVTVTRMVPPMSPDAIVYVPLVAPPRFVQPVPAGPQRFHW